MPKKKSPAEHAAGTQNIAQFFGAASPSQTTAHNPPPARVPAAQPVARPAQRNLKLSQIETHSGARGAARGRASSPSSEQDGEELLYSGTLLCAVHV